MSRSPDAPGDRNVETSIAAADAIAPKLGRLQRMVVGAITAAGAHGVTADELSARLAMDRWPIQPRTSDLKRMGMLRDSGQGRPNCTGKCAIVWTAARRPPPRIRAFPAHMWAAL